MTTNRIAHFYEPAAQGSGAFSQRNDWRAPALFFLLGLCAGLIVRGKVK